MTNNNYNVQTDEQIARDILSILPDAPEEPNKEPTESPKVFMLPIRQLKSFQNHPFKIVDNDEMKDLMHSIFTNLLYCGDCGHKLWFNINKQNPSIRFYSCSNYKGLRGTCESTHYVREDSLEQVVKMELFKLATYLDHDENAFAELLEHKSNKDSMAERKAAESALAAATARSQELLRLYERVYEDNVNGKVTDDWFMRLSHKYEVEQEELKKQMFDLKNKVERLDTAQNSSGSFIRAIRKFMTMQTLTPIVLQELIDKIEVFPIEGTGKNRTQRLVIHYRFVGCIDLPSIVPKHTYKLDSRQGVAIEYLPSAV